MSEEKKVNQGTQDNDGEGKENMIPYERFKEVNDKKKELEDKINSMDNPEDIKQQYETKLDKMKSEMSNKEKRYALRQAAINEGIRDDALEDFEQLVDLDDVNIEEDGVEAIANKVKEYKDKKRYFFNQDNNVDKAGDDFKGDDSSAGDGLDAIKKVMGIK